MSRKTHPLKQTEDYTRPTQKTLRVGETKTNVNVVAMDQKQMTNP